MPVSGRPALRRLARRVATGFFLDVWPPWAAASLLAAGIVALVCRLFVSRAEPLLAWLWLAPVLIAFAALAYCVVRAYRPDEIVALADSLSGGHGLWLTLFENNDSRWTDSTLVETRTTFALPRLQPWRKLSILVPAAAFLAATVLMPQRGPGEGSNAILADDIAADLTATVVELKQHELITADEEKRLEEEIERIRRGAEERVDSSSWEAADALREKVAAGLSEKQEAMKWAEESLQRYATAARSGASAPGAEAHAAELTKALEKLAQSGLLASAPPELQRLLTSGKLPTDPESLRALMASLSEYLADASGRLGSLTKPGKEFGRFDPSEFPLDSSAGEGEKPGRGGVNRGRADAPLTWGKETLPFDRFKAEALPPGAARSPDDWAPLVELPGAPQESPQSSARSSASQYAAAAGQSAWRRTLAPRHHSAVKKYFQK